jgi:hypothetical protein
MSNNSSSSSDDDGSSTIIKDLVNVVCYPTVFNKRYIKTLIDTIDTKLPKMRDGVVYYGPCTTIRLYTTKTTSTMKILKPIIDEYQLCGLRCGISVVSGKTDHEYWVVQVGGPCVDDNDYFYKIKTSSSDNINPLFV